MLKVIKYKDVKQIYKIDEYGNIYSEYKKGYMKPKKDKDGYLSVRLSGENKFVYVRIATLVAYIFIGEPPKEIKDVTVDHIDKNRLNNHYSNLRWLERAENARISTKVSQLGSNNSQAKLNENNVIEICELLMEDKLSLREIAKIYNVEKTTISNIRRKKSWESISSKYDFPKSIVKRDDMRKIL